MKWLEKIARPEVWQMKSYSSARSEMADVTGMIQLDANENPYAPYLQTTKFTQVNRYPDPQPMLLLSKLAALYHVKLEQVLIARGMDEVIDLLVRAFCRPYEDNVVITPPTFGYYEIAASLAPSKISLVHLNSVDNFSLDVDKIIAASNANTKIVFLCTPNNPTGSTISLDQIETIAAKLSHTIIAIDEAYLEFSDMHSATTLLDKYSNIVVMKTLSKAYACAGIRIGTLIAHFDIINLLRKIIAPYPIASNSVALVLDALSPFGLKLALDRIKQIKMQREYVYNMLCGLPDVYVYPSKANFLLLRVKDAEDFCKHLLSHGIIVRNRSHDISNTVRITIGSIEENNLLLNALGISTDSKMSVERTAIIRRKTNETEVSVEINLDNTLPLEVHTGIGFFDHMLEQLAKHGGFSLRLRAIGDTHIDYHHTVEDVAIVLGKALNQALGDRNGINRYGFVLPMDESCAFATIDLSGRGLLVYEAQFAVTSIGGFPIEMVHHFFLSLAMHMAATIHLKVTGSNSHHMVEALFKSCARALNQAILNNNTDMIPSTKGVI